MHTQSLLFWSTTTWFASYILRLLIFFFCQSSLEKESNCKRRDKSREPTRAGKAQLARGSNKCVVCTLKITNNLFLCSKSSKYVYMYDGHISISWSLGMSIINGPPIVVHPFLFNLAYVTQRASHRQSLLLICFTTIVGKPKEESLCVVFEKAKRTRNSHKDNNNKQTKKVGRACAGTGLLTNKFFFLRVVVTAHTHNC